MRTISFPRGRHPLSKLLQFSLFPQPEDAPPAPPVESGPEARSEPPPPPDAAARAQALDIQRSFIVEAPAGSGKTGLLMQRFLKLLATVDDPAEVLAITFTRRATAELRDRVLARLEDAAANIPPKDAFERTTRTLALAVLARDTQRDWRLIDTPNRLNIRTIDSLAGELAVSRPVLSGSGVTPTEDAAPLFAEAARRTTMLLGGSDPALSAALVDLLLHRDNNLPNCEQLIAEMLSLRDQWHSLVPTSPAHLEDTYLDAHILPQLEHALDLIICRGLTALTRHLSPSLLQDLCTLAADMGHSPGYKGQPSPLAFCAGRNTPPGELAEHLDHWTALIDLLLKKDGEFRKSGGLNRANLNLEVSDLHKEELGRILDSVRHDDVLRDLLCATRGLPPARYPADQWQVAKSLFRVLAQALEELQQVFAQSGTCDFTEINLRAADALRSEDSSGELPAGARLQHLLVDEMQDTSAGQYQLIELLTAHWDGGSQTLFLVGDPRQSIYLFRQARVERFIHTMRAGTLSSGPDAIPLTVLRLTANFRSQQRLVEAFNHDFSRIFPNQLSPAQAPYTPAQPVRPPGFSQAATWHVHTLPIVATDQRTKVHRRQLAADAGEIRSIIQHWQSIPPPNPGRPWRIAVLVAARTHLLQIVRALRDHGIPYRAVNVEPLRERQEILDLLALTRALLHPADRTAWLSLLRTPWCGLTLADLHLLAGADDASLASLTVLEAIAQRSHLLSSDGQLRLLSFHAVITSALAQRGRLPFSQWISRTWHAFGAAAFTDAASLLNVERFFALLDGLSASLTSASPDLDLAALARRLEALYAAPSLAPNAVDLMTIHTAKGLEWDVVLIPALERVGRTSTNRLLSWLETDPQPGHPATAPGIVAPIFARGAEKGPLQQYIWNVHSARELAERKRLFYVACTRAREELHLFASARIKSGGALEHHPNSLLDAAWPAAEPHFAANQPASQTTIQPAPIFQMPAPLTAEPLALAAAADPAPVSQTRTIQRIPLSAFALPVAPTPGSSPPPPYERPEGSVAARAAGNTLHSLLELLAQLHAAGESLASIQQQIRQWPPRVAALLRSAGLAPAHVDRLTPAIVRGLLQTLSDPHGRWLLAPHPRAASEAALTSAFSGDTRGIRLDRTFLAGPTPLTLGATHLWIIDFKTTTHSRREVQAFLATERQKYSAQLQAYAAGLEPLGFPIRLALYYPMLPALTWWDPTTEH